MGMIWYKYRDMWNLKKKQDTKWPRYVNGNVYTLFVRDIHITNSH